MFLSCSLQELGFPGVEIGSHINDWNLDAPELQCFFAVSYCNIFNLPYFTTLLYSYGNCSPSLAYMFHPFPPHPLPPHPLTVGG